MARILIAEDDLPTRRLIAGILADFGHEVEECGEDREAQARLRSDPFDVLVTDLVLRGVEGDRLGRASIALGVPAVTLTGWPYRPGRSPGRRPRPLREKPFRVADLQGVVDAVAAAKANPVPRR